VERLRDILQRTESVSDAALEYKKGSPLYTTLQTHSKALKSVHQYYLQYQERAAALGEILSNLKEGYNPNYQDMAVLEAVRGWDALNAPEEEETEEEKKEVKVEDKLWTEDQIKYQLDGLLNKDYPGLLIEHDTHLAKAEEDAQSSLFDLSAYLPENMVERYETLRVSIVELLLKLGIIRSNIIAPSEETKKARDAFNSAEKALNEARQGKEADEAALRRLFAEDGFGRDGAWKKLENTCLSKDNGDYTYEVCLFGAATQKATRGGNNNLGSFSSWHLSATPGTLEYYSRQIYSRGARCWNGPERSVTLDLVCGTENAILTVTEPEKCEYHLTGTTPALCLPLSVDESHEEL